MSLVKRLILPIGAFLFFSAGSIGFKLSDIRDANLFKTYNTPPVQRVLQIEEEFASLDDNRELLAENPGKYRNLISECSDSLQNPQTREYLRKIPDPDRRNHNEGFYAGIFVALASIGWGAFRIGRYRAQKETEGKGRRA